MYDSTVIIMLPACSSSLVSSSHSYDEPITNRHPRNDAAACVRCVLHPLLMSLSSCLGCIPPPIGLPFLRFYAVVSSLLFLLFVFFLFFFCLVASSSSSLHAAMSLRPPSVTASTQTSALNAIIFQSPVMPNARMSLCTQSVHSFSFPPRPLRNAPSRFQHACLVFVVDHTRCMYGI